MKKRVFLSFLVIFFIGTTSDFLNQAYALDPKLKAKTHNVKVLEIKSKKDCEYIWDLRENPQKAEIIILDVWRGDLESAQIDILDKWVQNGGCLWLKSNFPIGHKWEFDGGFCAWDSSISAYPYMPIKLENKEGVFYILPHPINNGVGILSFWNVRIVKQNFDSETQIIIQFEGIRRPQPNQDIVAPVGTKDFEKLANKSDSQFFPILVAMRYGKGRILFGKFDASEIYDWERFWFNLKEWGVGYNVPEVKGNPSSSLFVTKAFAEEVTTTGSLTIVSFEPTKEKNIVRERTEWASRKLVELTSKKIAGEIITELVGKVASKAFGFVTSIISQMPTVGNPTEIECYFVVGEEVARRVEVNAGEPFGVLVYISPGDLLQNLIIELKRDSQVVYSEKVPYPFFQERYGCISLIATSQPLTLSESGEYRLIAVYGDPKSTASLQIR